MGHIADQHSMRVGFVVPLVCFVLVSLYGLSWAKLSRLDSLPRIEE
jgi:FHS family L-fucose permease-like MFS transporter